MSTTAASPASTNCTTDLMAYDVTHLETPEEIGLLGVELGLGEHAPPPEVVETLELIGQRRPLRARPSARTSGRHFLHLPIDLLLHPLGVGHLAQRLLPALTRRLH